MKCILRSSEGSNLWGTKRLNPNSSYAESIQAEDCDDWTIKKLLSK